MKVNEVFSILNAKIKRRVPFKFGIDEKGNYGYYKEGENTVTPFGGGVSLTSYSMGPDLLAYESIEEE